MNKETELAKANSLYFFRRQRAYHKSCRGSNQILVFLMSAKAGFFISNIEYSWPNQGDPFAKVMKGNSAENKTTKARDYTDTTRQYREAVSHYLH